MRCFVIPLLLLAFLLPACEDILDDDDDDNGASYYGGSKGSGGDYTITVVSERYDTVEVRLDGNFMGNLMRYGSKLEFTAEGGEHKIEFWGQTGVPGNWEDVLVAEDTFFIDGDMVITIKPL
ncbi:hypothetical protein ACFL6S_06545 [Candidatus Poribacteria bacterium]